MTLEQTELLKKIESSCMKQHQESKVALEQIKESQVLESIRVNNSLSELKEVTKQTPDLWNFCRKNESKISDLKESKADTSISLEINRNRETIQTVFDKLQTLVDK